VQGSPVDHPFVVVPALRVEHRRLIGLDPLWMQVCSGSAHCWVLREQPFPRLRFAGAGWLSSQRQVPVVVHRLCGGFVVGVSWWVFEI
jgi:hypothetical protein